MLAGPQAGEWWPAVSELAESSQFAVPQVSAIMAGAIRRETEMAHLVYIEDEIGDLIDYRVYCSDFCARIDELYAGWNGCHEISSTQPCEECYATVAGLDEWATV